MWLYRLSHYVRPLCGLYWRFGLRGEPESIPADGPLIVVANHTSFLDPWFVGFPFPRDIRFLITPDWYGRSRVWSAFFRAYGAIPLRRSDPEATVLAISECLTRNEVVGIFPEGSISRDGRIRPFRSGIARIAARTGAPVQPLGIVGAFRSLPRHRRFPRPGEISIHVGPPLRFPGSPRGCEPDGEEIREFRDRLFREVCTLSGQHVP